MLGCAGAVDILFDDYNILHNIQMWRSAVVMPVVHIHHEDLLDLQWLEGNCLFSFSMSDSNSTLGSCDAGQSLCKAPTAGSSWCSGSTPTEYAGSAWFLSWGAGGSFFHWST